MAKIDLDIPDALENLPVEGRNLLLRRALRSAAKERIEQVELEVKECERKIDLLVEKYGVDFATFEGKVEQQEYQGVETQEDYHDWYFWRECKQRAEDALQNLRRCVIPC